VEAEEGSVMPATFPSLGSLLDSLCSAIIREEGRPADDTNPGDLRDCPWFPAFVIPATAARVGGRGYPDGSKVAYKALSSGKFWNPRTRAEGIAGLCHVAALHVAELNDLKTFVYIFAPPSENNSATYLKNVMEWTGIEDSSVPLYTLVGS
jgi:hypothetical protein